MILFHVHDELSGPAPSRPLPGGWTAVAVELGRLPRIAAAELRHCLFDVDIKTLAKALQIRAVVSRSPKPASRIFACRRGDRHAAIQAGALGATDIVDSPVSDAAVAGLLLAGEPVAEDDRPPSAVVGALALDDAFQALSQGSGLSARRFRGVASDVAREVSDLGLAPWLGAIRRHHLGTYQHCLLVTGLAASFGHALGLAPADLAELTTAALLHDIGKARISLDVLDKPGRLDPDELALVRMHPVWGDAYLRDRSDVSLALRDVVRHHHEYLDGSGYPDGLAGAAIADMTRLVTIVDIFAALVERRAYKPPAAPEEAYAVLVDMAERGQLEAALVKAFGPVMRALATGTPA